MANWIHILQDLGNIKTIIRTLTGWVCISAVTIFHAMSGPRLQILAQRLYFSLKDVTSPPPPFKKKKKSRLIYCVFNSFINHSTCLNLIKILPEMIFPEADGLFGKLMWHTLISTKFR